jgi:tetratricopeptide (TPR) repeat protein
MKRVGTTLLAASLLTGACAASRPDRPPVDPEAMREAAQGARTIDRYASSRAYLHYLNAKLLEADGDHEGALEELKLAVVYDDEAPELRLALGWLYARLNVLDKAEAEARRAEKLDPRAHGPHLLLGKLHAAKGRDAEAVAALERAIALAPSEEEAYLTLIRVHAEAGEPAKAEKVAARLSRVQPNDGEAYRLLARAAADRRDAAAEERHLRTAVERDPWDFGSRLKLAAMA